MTESRAAAVPVYAGADLGWWVARGWAGAVDLQRLAGLERFVVRTRNSVYDITVLSPSTGEVLVRGGRFFPEHTRAYLAGCSLGGSCLRVHTMCPGFLMELVWDGETIVTTRVRSIDQLEAPAPH